MADETKRVIDQTTDTSLAAGDFIIVDSQSEGTRKFDLGTELTGIKQDLANIYVQDGKLYIDGVAYELGGVGISNIAKTGTDGLVDTYTITMTDGTTYTFTVTNGDASDAEIQGFIDDWLDEHPEATTTVQDGAVTMAKLAPDVVAKFDDKATSNTGKSALMVDDEIINIELDEKDIVADSPKRNLDFLRRALYDNDIDQHVLAKKLKIDVETIDYWFRHDKCYISYFFLIAKYTGMKLKIDIKPNK